MDAEKHLAVCDFEPEAKNCHDGIDGYAVTRDSRKYSLENKDAQPDLYHDLDRSSHLKSHTTPQATKASLLAR